MRVKVKSLDECWEWQGSSVGGYGRINLNHKQHLVHRLIFGVFYGSPSETEEVRHKCDNPRCVNPLHLELGSHADNMKDRALRTGVASRKLTPQQVFSIRQSAKSQYQLAREYGVSQSTISNLKVGKTYTHWGNP